MDEFTTQIKKDLETLHCEIFFEKYYLNDDYWYFEHVLNYSGENLLSSIQQFKKMIADYFKIQTENVFLVGSAKLGISLSPPKKDVESKFLKQFRIDGDNPSDLDIAIISEELFRFYWDSYRAARYYSRYESTYKHIYNETYRGYINSKNLIEIDECRKLWNEYIKVLQRKLQYFHIKNEIQFRIYRNKNDFLQYHHQGIKKIRRM